MAVVPDRLTEFFVDGALGLLLVAGAMYVLLTVFSRNRGDSGQPRPPRF